MNSKIDGALKWLKDVHERWKPLELLVGGFAAVLVAIVGANWFLLVPRIEEIKKEAAASARAAVISPDVLADISKRVRPYAIFDVSCKSETATFTHNAGATDIIESVTLRTAKTNTQGILTVKLNRFVSVPPLVRPLTPLIYVNQAWRTNKFDWAYDIRPASITDTTDNSLTMMLEDFSEERRYTFLVELLTN
ncbi:MAG TPA: hypothetical protein VK633_10960 [Verrucomicrobiae bacterium]|nr:hypothetical protein [Verrucomicrobiae bacterium]